MDCEFPRLFLIFLVLAQFSMAAGTYNRLVYNICSNQTLSVSKESQLNPLHSLFRELLPQSSKSKFFRATAQSEDHGPRAVAAISGLYQCRGDLSSKDCYDCVTTLPYLSQRLCNKTAAGRIHLEGCYFHYESDEFIRKADDRTLKHVLIHKFCGLKTEEEEGSGLAEQRDRALEDMEIGVIAQGNKGFYSGAYESAHAMAQCEGDLEACDCGECVSNAVQIAQEQCSASISSQVFLDRCFISYNYYPHGNSDHNDKEIGESTGKKVAIVLGGGAALGFGFILLLFIKSCGKKDDDCW